jgi:hypothetical protein
MRAHIGGDLCYGSDNKQTDRDAEHSSAQELCELRVEGHCHDAAHHAFMALPPYTRTREGEAPQLGGGLTPCRQRF